MSPSRESSEIHALAGAYAADALDPFERAAFEAHLRECEPCLREVAELRATAALLGAAAAAAPPPHLRAVVLEAARRLRQEPVRARQAWPARRSRGQRLLAVAAALLAAALVGGAGVALAQANRAAALHQAVAVVAADDARQAELVGTAGAARLVWSAERDAALLFASELPRPADGTYALWLIHDDTPVLVAAFDAAPAGRPAALVEGAVAGATAVTVTLEPHAEVTSPTGPVLLEAPLT